MKNKRVIQKQKTSSKEEGVGKTIFEKIRKRDFTGNSGQAIKNSGYRIAKLLTAKIGSLLFTIIIARLLMPELFGLYGLALSTILFIGAFSDVGVSKAMITMVSKTVDKNKKKAKAYFDYASKVRFILVSSTSIILIILSYWISNSYYQKPIFYALLAGAIYLPLSIFSGYLANFFNSQNNFKTDFFGEIIFQLSRMTILPILILFILSMNYSPQILLLGIFIGLSLCFFLLGIYYLIILGLNNPFKGLKKQNLSKKEKKDFWKFVLPLTLTALSGIFFGYVDTIMLGHFVESQFIGFYQAALNLVSSATAMLGFTAVAVFPIFSRMKGDSLERGFRKTKSVAILTSLLTVIITFLVAKPLVYLVYGANYSSAIIYLQVFSLLILILPLAELYQIYFISQKKTKSISLLLVISTALNVLFNYILIKNLLAYGMGNAVLGACLATILSRAFYLVGLIYLKRKN